MTQEQNKKEIIPFHITDSTELMSKPIPDFPYLVDKIIPRKAITALTADSGKGKSLVALIMACYISQGIKMFGEYKTEKTNTLIIDQEMDEDLIIDRYRKVVKIDTPIFYIHNQDFKITDENHYIQIKSKIIKKEIGFIIFDTFSMIHTNDENSSNEMVEVNKQMLKLISETGVTIMYLHHHRKQMRGEVKNQSTSRGSTDIIAKVASHLLLDGKDSVNDHGDRVLELTLSQEKARRPEAISKIGIDITYREDTKLTEWKFKGTINDKLNKQLEAQDFAITTLKMDGNTVGFGMTFQDLWGRAKDYDSFGFGVTNLRKALRDLENNNILITESGGNKGNAKVYKFNKINGNTKDKPEEECEPELPTTGRLV